MGLRGKVDITLNNRDASGNLTTVAASQQCTPVRAGASIIETKTISDASLTVKVDNPGTLKDGDIVWCWDISAGEISANDFQLNGDPVYNVSTDDWTITFNTGITSTAVSPGDRLILDITSGHRITTYASEVGSTLVGSSNQVTADADGRIEFYTEWPSIDIWFDSSSPNFRIMTGLKPQFRRGINVKEFGAVGDNSTDDTLAFQKALNMAEALEGVPIYVPDGIYKITSTLTLSLNTGISVIDIFGDGADSNGTRIQFHPSDTTSDLFDIDAYGTSNTATVNIRNISFGCTKDGANTGRNCIYLKNGGRCVLDNIYVFDYEGGAGVKFDATDGRKSDLNRLVNSYIGECMYGLEIDCSGDTGAEFCNAHFVDNCIFGTNETYDLYIHNSGSGSNLGVNSCRVNNTWFQVDTTASATRGVYIGDDAGNIYLTAVSLDGTSTVTCLTVEATAGRVYFRGSVDGLISDASGNLQVGWGSHLSTGDHDEKQYTFVETKAAAGTISINENTDVVKITGTSPTITQIDDCYIGRKLKVSFESASPPDITDAGGAADGAFASNIIGPHQDVIYEFTGVDDGSGNIVWQHTNGGPFAGGRGNDSVATAATLDVDQKLVEVTGTGTNISKITVHGADPIGGEVIHLVATDGTPPALVHTASPAAGQILCHTGANITLTQNQLFTLAAVNIGGTVSWRVD